MNNVDTLTALLSESPDDDITAYLLTDALMEERDYTRTEANRAVVSVRAAAFDARDLADAAAVIRPGSEDRERCLSLIRRAAATSVPASTNVILVPGGSAPNVTCEYRSAPHRWWYDWTATVGATWLLSALRLAKVRDELAARKKAKRGTRK